MTSRAQAEKRNATLREEIRRHEHLYYALDRPEISDQAYDALERELRDLEEAFPDLVTPDSPTQRVGERPSEEFPSFAHRVPMLSLDNTYSEDELREFRARFGIPIDDETLASAPLYRPADDSPELVYLRERRAALGVGRRWPEFPPSVRRLPSAEGRLPALY